MSGTWVLPFMERMDGLLHRWYLAYLSWRMSWNNRLLARRFREMADAGSRR